MRVFITLISLAMFWFAVEANNVFTYPLMLPVCILAYLGSKKLT